MKNFALLLLLVLGLSCKKESVDKQPTPPGKRFARITYNNKPYLTFEYQKGLLVKENAFNFCETNPVDEFTYEYNNGQLSKLTIIIRSIYSSMSALCEQASGIKTEESFSYNSKGQVIRISRGSTSTEFSYNAQGQIEKQSILGGNKPIVTLFEYDSKGNLIKETDPTGEVGYYEYDNKINPYYQINQRPQWISPFNKSPNNVIKGTGRYTFRRSFEYDSDGYPTKLLDDNGGTYLYHYE